VARQAVELVEQLAAEAGAVEVAQVPSRLHPDIIRLTQTWQQAAAANRQDPRQHSDASSQELVTLRIVRTLAAVAHATQLALGENGRGVAGLGREEADGFRRLLQRHEQLALRSVYALPGSAAGSPAATADTPPDAPVDSPIEQLSTCLKQWAPLAIVAAADPTTSARDLRRIAMTEAFSTAAAGGLVVAAGRQQELPIEALPHLQRRLKTATQHWKHTAGQWQWIRRFGAPEATERLHRVSHDLAVAVADVHQRERPVRPPGHTTRATTGPTGVPAADLLPVLRQVTENSAILAEIFARLPSRTHRHDDAGRLRPVLFAPQRVLQQIATDAYTRERAQFRPGAQISPTALDLPLASRRGDQLRALTPDAAAYLRASGADLARAAAAAEQALELTGFSPRSRAPRPTTPPAPTHHPVPPYMPGHPQPGSAPDPGIPR